jgi:hypothetical protein
VRYLAVPARGAAGGGPGQRGREDGEVQSGRNGSGAAPLGDSGGETQAPPPRAVGRPALRAPRLCEPAAQRMQRRHAMAKSGEISSR